MKGTVNEALNQKRISLAVHNFMLETIHPNKTLNPILEALGELNDLDKHMLLLPIYPMMQLGGFGMEDEKGKLFMEDVAFYCDSAGRFRLDKDSGSLKLNKQGNAAATIIFSMDLTDLERVIPFMSQAVIPALNRVAEEVTRTVKEFESLLFGKTEGQD